MRYSIEKRGNRFANGTWEYEVQAEIEPVDRDSLNWPTLAQELLTVTPALLGVSKFHYAAKGDKIVATFYFTVSAPNHEEIEKEVVQAQRVFSDLMSEAVRLDKIIGALKRARP